MEGFEPPYACTLESMGRERGRVTELFSLLAFLASDLPLVNIPHKPRRSLTLVWFRRKR